MWCGVGALAAWCSIPAAFECLLLETCGCHIALAAALLATWHIVLSGSAPTSTACPACCAGPFALRSLRRAAGAAVADIAALCCNTSMKGHAGSTRRENGRQKSGRVQGSTVQGRGRALVHCGGARSRAYRLSRRSSVCSRSRLLRTPSSAVRTAVAAAEAAVRGPLEEERRWALACRGHTASGPGLEAA